MKLIYCPKCKDIVRLRQLRRQCDCGASWGCYEDDGYHATIGGDARCLGIDNSSFAFAVQERNRDGRLHHFSSFVIERECPAVHREDVLNEA